LKPKQNQSHVSVESPKQLVGTICILTSNQSEANCDRSARGLVGDGGEHGSFLHELIHPVVSEAQCTMTDNRMHEAPSIEAFQMTCNSI
jgi:hypothetical protein